MGLYLPLAPKPLYHPLDSEEGLCHLTSVRLSTGILALVLVLQRAVLEVALLRTSWCRCAWLGRWPRRDVYCVWLYGWRLETLTWRFWLSFLAPWRVFLITFLVSSPQTFWPSTEHMPNPFVCIVMLRSTAPQELDCYAYSAILHCLLLVNFSVSFPGPTLEFQLGYSWIPHHILITAWFVCRGRCWYVEGAIQVEWTTNTRNYWLITEMLATGQPGLVTSVFRVFYLTTSSDMTVGWATSYLFTQHIDTNSLHKYIWTTYILAAILTPTLTLVIRKFLPLR